MEDAFAVLQQSKELYDKIDLANSLIIRQLKVMKELSASHVENRYFEGIVTGTKILAVGLLEVLANGDKNKALSDMEKKTNVEVDNYFYDYYITSQLFDESCGHA